MSTTLATSRTEKYKTQEVPSNHGYLSGYSKPKTIAEQVNILSGLFSGTAIGFADADIARGELPDGAEGYFAIPRWQSIAPTYGEAVQKVLNALKKAYKYLFKNWREGQLGPDQLRQSAKSAAFWEQIGEQQKGFDILLVPAQFGLRHRGRSVRRACTVMEQNECGLGVFAVGIMLLTHELRLKHHDDLWIDCAGDEFRDQRDSDAPFDHAPYFCSHGDPLGFGHVLGFGAAWSGFALGYCGSASGWSVLQA